MKAYALTDTGLVRFINQDFIFCSDNPVGNLPNLYIVADGMGGHKAGDMASRYTVETVIDSIRQSQDADPIRIMNKAIITANDMLLSKAEESEDYTGMGTTLVVASIIHQVLHVANVGDSRLYLANSDLRQITRDHSLVEEMVSIGEIDREKARTHKNKNIITRAIGGDASVIPDFFTVDLKEQDVILMCTDGLSNMVEDSSILDIIKNAPDMEAAAEQLIQTANANGGKDNISVILIADK